MAIGSGTASVAGQLPGASAAIPATGYAYAARARGAVAVGANPAGLGMPDSPRWSLVLPAFTLRTGLGPVTLGDLNRFDGETVPRQVKLQWQERIEKGGTERGRAAAEVTALGFSRGRWGVQVTSVAGGSIAVGPDAAELLLFGNSGRTGEPRELDLSGSRVDGFVVTTVGVSAGFPVGSGPSGDFAVGATLSLSLGNALLLGRDAGSLTRSEPLEVAVQLPVVHPDFSSSGFSSGSGFGLDAGGAWRRGAWSAGVVVKNLLQTFSWNADELVFRAGQALFNAEDVSSDFEKRPFEEAPAALRAEVEELGFRRRIGLATAYRATPRLTLSAEVQQRLGSGGLDPAPRSRIGAGAEYERGLLTLRGGLGRATDGWLVAGGIGARWGRARIDGAAVSHPEDDAVSWALSLSLAPR